jgi:hypothetical protein
MAEYQRWYRFTASVTNGATAVTGTLSALLANARPGDIFVNLATWQQGEVASVESNTGLTLGDAWAGSTVMEGNCAIIRSGPAWGQVADLAVQFAALIDSQTDIFSGTGAPSDELGADGSAYFQLTPPTFYLKAAGTWGTGISLVGPQGPAGPSFAATSSSIVTIGTGAKAFDIGTGKAYSAGMRARATATSDPTKWAEGVVSSYTGGILTINVDLIGGSGEFNSWAINTAGERGAIGLTGPSYAATSTSSLAIGTGSKAFTTQAGLAYGVGSRARAASNADPTKWMEGPVTGYSGTTLTIGVDLTSGHADTLADWSISLAGQRGITGASYAATSTTSRNLGTGSMSFTVQANLAIVVGSRMRAASNANPTTKWMEGVVTAYSGTSLTVLFDLFAGSGAVSDWNFSITGERGTQGIQGDVGAQGDQGATGATGPNTGLDYAYDPDPTDSDPGSGDIRLNNATWGLSSYAFISKTGRNGEEVGDVISALCGSNSAHRAHVRLFPLSNRAVYLEAEVEGSLVDGGTYWKVPLSGVKASVALPTSGAVMCLDINRTGDASSPTQAYLDHAAFGGL